MKKLLILFLSVIAVSAFFFAGCNEEPSVETHTITFVQDGEEDFVITIEHNESISYEEMPTPAPVKGHSVRWDIPELKNVTTDRIVTAVAEPNWYQIYYNFNSLHVENKVANFSNQENIVYDSWRRMCRQAVKFGTEFTLNTPGNVNAPTDFLGWKIQGETEYFTSGTYSFDKDIILMADWEPVIYRKITFVQEGYSNIVRQVVDGASLADSLIPSPRQDITGHTVSWEITEFNNVTTDITVNAVATPNTYKIYLDKGDIDYETGNESTRNKISFDPIINTFDSVKGLYYIEVVYGEEFTLPTLSVAEGGVNYGAIFSGYELVIDSGEYFIDGEYLYGYNITLTADWDYNGTTPPPLS